MISMALQLISDHTKRELSSGDALRLYWGMNKNGNMKNINHAATLMTIFTAKFLSFNRNLKKF